MISISVLVVIFENRIGISSVSLFNGISIFKGYLMPNFC